MKVFLALLILVLPLSAADRRLLPKEALLDKIRGGWAGQMFGVVYGGPTEFRALGTTYDGGQVGTPGNLKDALDQDDLYVEMTLAEVMDSEGLNATSEQYGLAFRDSKYRLWHANLSARRNLARGIKAPDSGHPRYNAHANDIDFQIESDFLGLMSPGLPRAVQFFADRVGRVMNYGDGLYGGVFIGAMYAAAFFEDDPRRVVEAGLAAIPERSAYAAVIRETLAWRQQFPGDWRAAWKQIVDKWDRDDVCPEGAHSPFNIDAKLNGAFVALGLLYGERDFERTMEISMRAGQDSDCNPSNAAGILGVMLGYSNLPGRWTEALEPLKREKFKYTNFSFDSIVASTLSRAANVVERYGGRVTPDGLEIPDQAPEALKLEQWEPGQPAGSLPVTDAARWTWKGQWARTEGGRVSAYTDEAGAEATVTFEGTGAILVGSWREDGGYAEVYLDGRKVADTDGYVAGGNRDAESLWHADGLPAGTHVLRIVVSGRRYPRSRGAFIYLQRLIVLRK